MAEGNAIIKIISTTDNKFANLPYDEGQLIFVTDNPRIALDYNGVRTEYQSSEDIIAKESYLDFPPIGDDGRIYIDTSNNATYRWDSANLKYFCIGRDYNALEIINGDF